MNVKEMLEEIPKRWPSAMLKTKWDTGPGNYCLVTLDNGWGVGIGYDERNYSSTRIDHLKDPLACVLVEVAVYEPSGKWYITEVMSVDPTGKSGVLSWVNSETVFEVLEYISQKEGE